MSTALNDLAVLKHDDLVRTLDGRQSMRDNKRGTSSTKRPQTILNHRFALAVKTGGSLVQNQEARIRQNRTGNGDTLTLPPRQLDATLTDDRVISVRETMDELVAVGDTTYPFYLRAGRMAPSKTDIRGNRPVE